MWPVIAVYQMLWVNPRPEVAIKSVRLYNPKMESVPVLIGLTAAVDAGQDLEAAQRVAMAKELLAQALAAISAKDDAKARALLKQAVQKDPTLWDAHRALADLCEKGGDDNVLLQVYRDWADAGAIAPLPYNRMGQILEKRKDYRGALDAYTRSLKVEWNQPPIIEAKSRMEKLVNQK
jgi:tetratricopeptide (TPR) repeat protein